MVENANAIPPYWPAKIIDIVIINDNIQPMQWHISFYNQKVEAETLSFPKGILATIYI